MTTSKKWTIGLCLATTVLAGGWALAGTALAEPLLDDGAAARPLKMFFSGQIGRLITLRSELDLSTDQRLQIRTILKGHRQEIATVLQPVVEKRRALREATLAATLDDHANETKIRAAAAELGSAIGDAAVVGSKIKTEVRAVLTPEQQQKVDDFRSEAESAVDEFLKAVADPS